MTVSESWGHESFGQVFIFKSDSGISRKSEARAKSLFLNLTATSNANRNYGIQLIADVLKQRWRDLLPGVGAGTAMAQVE